MRLESMPASSSPPILPVPCVRLAGDRIYSCAVCRTHTSFHDDVISKAFQGRHGRAYLFNDVALPNVVLGEKEDRLLMSGLHTVRDLRCVKCQTTLGWKYEIAWERSQKYKEGKFILEKALVVCEW